MLPLVTVCVFAKPPQVGVSKTRLAPAVGEQGAAALAAAFLQDTWTAVRALDWADPVLVASEPHESLHEIAAGAPLWLQGRGDLGVRLERILRRALSLDRPAMALGADSPGLPPTLLERIRAALIDDDAVLGPAADGGFYALGMRRCPRGALSNLPWSAANTLDATVARLRSLGLTVTLGEPWFDLDRPEDLSRFRQLLTRGVVQAPATARALTALERCNAAADPAPIEEGSS